MVKRACLVALAGLVAALGVWAIRPATPAQARWYAALGALLAPAASPAPSSSTTPSPGPTTDPTPIGPPPVLTPVVTSNSPYFIEEDVRLSAPSTIAALDVTITVQPTTGVSFNGMYNTVGGAIRQSHAITDDGRIEYSFSLVGGQTLRAGTSAVFAAQVSGTGTAHPTAGDTFVVSSFDGAVTTIRSGHF